jgi:hypothetical protein
LLLRRALLLAVSPLRLSMLLLFLLPCLSLLLNALLLRRALLPLVLLLHAADPC